MDNHVLQFNDGGPDWCINCGTFAQWCTGPCKGGSGAYDNRKPENVVRVVREVFGFDDLPAGPGGAA